MRSTRKAVAVATGVLAVGALVAAPAAPGHASGEPARVTWGTCPELPTGTRGSARAGDLECGTLDVPVDYRAPDRGTMSIAVSRLRSGDPARRRGVLLVNPGGPGVAGLDLPVAIAERNPPRGLLDSYDLIGFDPRGVGHSGGVTCALSSEQQTIAFGTYAHGPDDVAEQAGRVQDIAEQCVAHGGPNLPHLTTRNTARDIDRIRQALGERRISYFGTSYGTYLGAVYLALFPDRADRFLLDSAADPDMVWREQFRTWGRGAEVRFPDFARWAAARHDVHHLGRTPEAVREKYFELAGALDAAPVAGVTGDVFRQLTRLKLYRDEDFPSLAAIWQSLSSGDAAGVRSAQPPDDGFLAAHLAVTCGDVAWPRSQEHYQRAVRTDRQRYPLVGALTANITPCARWPLAPLEEPTRIGGTGRAFVLILQNLRDPATVYAGGVALRGRLGERAALVTVDAGEHGVYLSGNTCANRLATEHLVAASPPTRDRFCPAESHP
ncbi:alpha/beta hydrolase [Actinosynnema sp. CS-041913]|uniref:alpha/beta hydrolase n=1 Tax=Actinosynnema sp. CS-041913 TaxID=3239917 RepID=UPI003D94E570